MTSSMAASPPDQLFPVLSSREDYFAFMDEWTVGTVDELRARKTTRGLVKAYLLETSRTDRDPVAALRSGGQIAHQLDETSATLTAEGDSGAWGFVDTSVPRYPVVLTVLDSQPAGMKVQNMVAATHTLDRAWIHGRIFDALWTVAREAFAPTRFSQLVFEHDGVYENAVTALGDDSVGVAPADANVERRHARLEFTERLGKLEEALGKMRAFYDPLHSIVRMRFPAALSGGHDVYHDGRLTNRSDSLASFMSSVDLVRQLYSVANESTEASAWPDADNGRGVSLGAALTFQFSEPLADTTFDALVGALGRKTNRFRIWGKPLDRGRRKVHMYAVDHHLWQPIDLELTSDRLVLLIPDGTCGNTVQRLLANLQRFVDPRVKAFLGEAEYDSRLLLAQLKSAS
jgi:hypothetical protein